MNTFEIADSQPQQGYFSNLARAAREFAKALVPVQVTRQDSFEELERLSARYEHAMPALANELRYMAGYNH